MAKRWSENELQFIKDNYKKLSDAEIAKELGRAESAVATKRKRLSLQRSKRKYSWNDVVEAFSKTDLILVSGEEDYKDSATNSIKYICPKHRDKGVMTIALGHLLNGEGCYYCGRETTGKKKMIYLDEKYYKRLCEERDFTYLGAERINGLIYVKFICNKHKEFGEQYQRIGNLKKNKSCQYCNNFNLPKWYIEEKIEEVNPNIEILSDYTKLTDYVECRCRKHNIISHKKIQDVLKGRCCFRCGMENRHSSYREDEICSLLEKWGYSYEREYTFKDCKDQCVLPFDFYIKDFNTCIEYDGAHHYEPIYGEDVLESTQKHDRIKDDYCRKNNIILIRIPYWEQDDISGYLFNEFLKFGIVELIC